ncbi:hypothetical protein [Alysiella crassa]|uniref:hypothetical protein n=1 Tax=Alysiella crassa TaxID=153491 RepID=UPI001470BA3D|nr:hypothetical protein [Alysiella crassa]
MVAVFRLPENGFADLDRLVLRPPSDCPNQKMLKSALFSYSTGSLKCPYPLTFPYAPIRNFPSQTAPFA